MSAIVAEGIPVRARGWVVEDGPSRWLEPDRGAPAEGLTEWAVRLVGDIQDVSEGYAEIQGTWFERSIDVGLVSHSPAPNTSVPWKSSGWSADDIMERLRFATERTLRWEVIRAYIEFDGYGSPRPPRLVVEVTRETEEIREWASSAPRGSVVIEPWIRPC